MNGFRTRACHAEVTAESMCSTNGCGEPIAHTGGRGAKATCDECAEILHGLSNVLASMLLNARVMEWKLPSYSRSKRYLHEIERNAQRGGELVKGLLRRLQSGCAADLNAGRECEVSLGLGDDDTVASRECAAVALSVGAPIESVGHSAPAFLPHGKKVSHTIV